MADKKMEVGLLIKVQSELAELKNTVRELKNTGLNIDKLDEQVSSLAKTMEKLGSRQKLIESFRALKTESQKTSESIEKAQQKVNELAKSGKKSGKAFNDAVSNVKRLRQHQNNLVKQTLNVRESLSAASISTKNLASEQKRLTKETIEANKAFQKINAKIEKLKKQKLGKDLKRDLDGAEKSASRLKTALGVAFAVRKVSQFFTSAVSGASNLEDALARVQAVSGATNDEMSKIAQKAEELGASTRYTATQAAQGFEILARAGLSASEQIATIPSVLALAQGQSIEMGEAAQFISDAVSIMGGSFEQAGHYADVLAKGASQANTTVPQLANAVSYAGQYAKEAGMSIEELVGVLDVLAENGVRGERAGTALRNVFAQMQDPTSKASQALRQLGVDTTNISTLIAGLKSAGARGSEAINAFGTEAGPALRALLSGGTEALNEYTDGVKNAAGTAENAAKRMDDTLSGAFAGLGSAWEGLKNSLAKPILAPLKNKLTEISTVIRELTSSGKIKELGTQIAEIFEKGANQVIAFVKTIDFKDKIDKIGASFEKLGSVASGLNGAFQALSIFTNSVKAGFAAIALVITNTIVGLADLRLGLIAVGEAVTDFFGITDKSSNSTIEKLKSIHEHADAVNHSLVDMIKTSSDSMANSIDSLSGNTSNAVEQIKTNLASIPQSVAEQTITATDKINNILDSYSIGAKSTAQEVQSAMTQILQDVSAPAELDALNNALIEQGNLVKLTAEQRKQLYRQTTEAGVAEVKRLYTEEEAAALEAQKAVEAAEIAKQQVREKAAQAAKDAFSRIGVDVDEVNTGISSSNKQMINDFAVGLEQAKAAGQDTSKLVGAAFEQMVKKLKSKEEFQAFNDALSKSGIRAQFTAGQMKKLEAGTKGGAKAVSEYTDNLKAQSEAAAKTTKESAENTHATNLNTAAKRKQIHVIEDVSKTEEKSTTSTQESSRKKTHALSEVSDSYAQVSESIEDTADSAQNAMAEMANFSMQAKDTADSIAASLAQLRGDEQANARLQQEQKLRQLNLKLQEAQARGNAEEAREYRRAINLQKQLYIEKQNQAQEKAKTDDKPTLMTTQNTTHKASSTNIDATKIADMWDERIAQAEQRGAELGKQKLMQELMQAAKRRAR